MRSSFRIKMMARQEWDKADAILLGGKMDPVVKAGETYPEALRRVDLWTRRYYAHERNARRLMHEAEETRKAESKVRLARLEIPWVVSRMVSALEHRLGMTS